MKITMVRHEISVGNELALKARALGALRVETPVPNPELPLSEAGRERANDIELPVAAWVSPVFCSPYKRAEETMEVVLHSNRYTVAVAFDERLRDRELGIFDGLTTKGIEYTYPQEFARREQMGKFYYRPSEGESWADVVLRVRAFLTEKFLLGEQSILCFSHDVTILAAAYVCEGLTVAQVLQMQADKRVPNGSITELEFGSAAIHRQIAQRV